MLIGAAITAVGMVWAMWRAMSEDPEPRRTNYHMRRMLAQHSEGHRNYGSPTRLRVGITDQVEALPRLVSGELALMDSSRRRDTCGQPEGGRVQSIR